MINSQLTGLDLAEAGAGACARRGLEMDPSDCLNIEASCLGTPDPHQLCTVAGIPSCAEVTVEAYASCYVAALQEYSTENAGVRCDRDPATLTARRTPDTCVIPYMNCPQMIVPN
jgi:hypothetical protein